MKRIKLYIPGPLEYYPFVRRVMKTIIHHRSEEFSLMMKRIRKNFSKILDSYPPTLFSSSGTGAINAVFQNFVDPTKKSLILSSGKFANRMLEIMRFYGISPTVIRAKPGELFNIAKIPKQEFDYVFMTYVETSTGTRNNVEEVISVIKKINKNTKVIVDAVSAFAAYEIFPEKIGIDILIGASHKALGCPPGISFIWRSENVETLKSEDFYFNFSAESQKQEKELWFRFTPPVEVISALDVSLEYVAQNPSDFIKLHQKRSDFFRRQIRKSGLELFSQNPANTVTAVKIKNADKITRSVLKKGFLIGKGAENYENIVRVSHMGDVSFRDLKIIARLIKKYNK